MLKVLHLGFNMEMMKSKIAGNMKLEVAGEISVQLNPDQCIVDILKCNNIRARQNELNSVLCFP